MQSQDRDVDPTTIYRIFDKLLKVHAIHELHGQFIKCSAPHNTEDDHHFLICDVCGEAEEIFLDYHDALATQLKQEKDFDLHEVDLIFYGICRHCQ